MVEIIIKSEQGEKTIKGEGLVAMVITESQLHTSIVGEMSISDFAVMLSTIPENISKSLVKAKVVENGGADMEHLFKILLIKNQ